MDQTATLIENPAKDFPLRQYWLSTLASLPDTEVAKLFKTYYGNLQEALDQAKANNRSDIAEQLKSELMIIQEFLPKALSPEETKKVVVQTIAESGAKTKKDLGLVMKAVIQLNSSVDGKSTFFKARTL